MKPELLHPAVVHLPLGITVVLPILAALAAWLYFRRRDSDAAFTRFWLALVICLVAASLGAFLAHETGEAGEHAIGKSLPEAAIELHEKYAKIFSILLYAATAVGVSVFFAKGRVKSYAILLVALLSAAALYAGVLTGNAGGELVYQHKAANYLMPESAPPPPPASPTPTLKKSP